MEYILFIHKNVDTPTLDSEWSEFFERARHSGLFLGGSEIGTRSQFGSKPVINVTESVAGFMRFEAENIAELEALLKYHPVAIHGGTLELCEMPKS